MAKRTDCYIYATTSAFSWIKRKDGRELGAMSESNDVTRLINNYAACIEKLLQGRTEKEKKLCFPFPKGTEHDVVETFKKWAKGDSTKLQISCAPPEAVKITFEVDSEGKYGRALKALLDQPRNWYTKSIAIVIGIDKYLHMKPLEGCVNDANAVAKLLEEKHEFTVIKLLDREATKENVLKYVLDKLCTSTGWKSIKGDDRTRAIIFFAGHGTQGGHLCPVDYNPENPLSSGISMDGFGLRGFEKELKPHHTLLILDACHASFSFSTAQGRRAMNERREEDLKQRCVEVLASTRSDQEAVEKKHSDGEMRGAFTTALVRALQDEVFEKRNIVDISEVHNFVKEVIEEPPKAQQSQFHRLDGFGSFLFMKKTKSTKSKKVKASPAEVPPSKVAQDVPMPAPPAAAGVVVQAAPSQEK